ncbi:unnamed protein product [Symbiodinium sp. CCMP2592]|nr:unnamed protein product [Symbiodinium sp. CCMP2592]
MASQSYSRSRWIDRIHLPGISVAVLHLGVPGGSVVLAGEGSGLFMRFALPDWGSCEAKVGDIRVLAAVDPTEVATFTLEEVGLACLRVNHTRLDACRTPISAARAGDGMRQDNS